jgi:hypothetical protein
MLDLSTLPQGRPTGGQSPSHAEVASASSLVLPVLGGQETRSIPVVVHFDGQYPAWPISSPGSSCMRNSLSLQAHLACDFPAPGARVTRLLA